MLAFPLSADWSMSIYIIVYASLSSIARLHTCASSKDFALFNGLISRLMPTVPQGIGTKSILRNQPIPNTLISNYYIIDFCTYEIKVYRVRIFYLT
jgi:hypothetical protein